MAGVNDVLVDAREEDFVEYFLFFDDPSTTKSAFEFADEVNLILSVVDKLSENYIWHKDEFNLIARTSALPPILTINDDQLPPHLYGVTHYGDNIEDEWFIVYLLKCLTKEITGLVARVSDSDGEFLLIEAADYIPKWASPDTCENRVYIYDGEVHMVKPRTPHKKLSVCDALHEVRTQPQQTVADSGVQQAVNARTNGYPAKIRENLHHTNAYVPAAIVALLNAKPSLIAPATIAFCHRDPIDMRVCRAMRYFPPETRVLTRVQFTRCLYAMLAHHSFTPDRRTGWDLPPSSSPLHQAHSLGVKLACGFEILVSQCKGSADGTDLSTDKGWQNYKESLEEKGYFKELLQGSQEHNRLTGVAEDYYRTHQTVSQPSTGLVVQSLLGSLQYDINELKKAGESLPPPDDDSWLHLSPDELEQILEQRYGARQSGHAENISSHLNAFLQHVSGPDGAEHPPVTVNGAEDSNPPLRPKRGVKIKKHSVESIMEDDSNKVNFDHEEFSCAVQNILDFVVPEDSWDLESDGSGMSSYEDEQEVEFPKPEAPISELKQYMDQMDRELSNTTLGQSFEKTAMASNDNKAMEDSFSDIESFEPVDIDMTALKNILESYQAQMGGAGPASNLLGPMGVRLEKK